MPKSAVMSCVGFEGGLVEALLGFVEDGHVPNASKILVRRSLFWFRAGFETMAASELDVAEAVNRGRAGVETMSALELEVATLHAGLKAILDIKHWRLASCSGLSLLLRSSNMSGHRRISLK